MIEIEQHREQLLKRIDLLECEIEALRDETNGMKLELTDLYDELESNG
jgi:hypothetical protein